MDINQSDMQNQTASLATPQPPQPYQPDNPLNPNADMPAGQPSTPMAAPGGNLPANAPAPSVTPSFQSPNIPGADSLGKTPLSFAQKLGMAADKLGIPTGPGGWAKSLVGAAQTALSGLSGLGHVLGNSMADASAAAKDIVPGQGPAGMLGNQLRAGQARQQEQQKLQTEQQKAQADIANSNVQRMYHQTLMHQMNDAINEKDITYGKSQVDSMTSHLTSLGLTPGEVVAKDITEDQLSKAMNDNSWNPTTEVYYPTGSFEVPGKKDEAGNPQLQKTYTIIRVPAEQTLTKDAAERITKYVPGVKFSEGQKVPGSTAVGLMDQAHIGETLKDLRDTQLEAAHAVKLKDLKDTVETAAIEADGRLAKNQDYLKAQGQAQGNLQGIYDYLNNKNPQEAADLITSYGGPKNFQAVVDKQKADFKKLNDAEMPKTVNEAQSKVSGAAIAYRDNPTPQNKKALDDAHVRLDDLRAVDISQKYADATSRVKANRDIEDEDLQIVAKELIKPDNMTALKDISSMRGDMRMRLYAEAKKLDKDFQPGLIDNKIRFLGQFTNPNGKTMMNIASNNTFLQHAGDLADINKEYSRVGSPFIDKPLNKLRGNVAGDEAFTRFMAAVSPVREEYVNALKAGFAPQGSDIEAGNVILSDASNMKQIVEATRQMSHTILRRMDAPNESFRTLIGGNYPDLITPGAMEAIDKLNDPALDEIVKHFSSGGTIGKTHSTPGKQIEDNPAAPPVTGPAGAPPAPVRGNFFSNFGGKAR